MPVQPDGRSGRLRRAPQQGGRFRRLDEAAERLRAGEASGLAPGSLRYCTSQTPRKAGIFVPPPPLLSARGPLSEQGCYPRPLQRLMSASAEYMEGLILLFRLLAMWHPV